MHLSPVTSMCLLFCVSLFFFFFFSSRRRHTRSLCDWSSDVCSSDLSPPTALSPFAAAAITGGDPYRTTLQAWKYTLPAFVVPFIFVLDPAGVGLLLKAPPEGSWFGVAWIAFTACVGIAALAAGVHGWPPSR